MTRIRFENLPSTNTPRNAENLNKLNNVVISSTEPTTGEEVWIDNTNKKIYTKNDNGVYEEFYREIESGNNNNGSYVKSVDGTMICKKQIAGTTKITSAWGTMYESSAIDCGNYATNFVETPRIYATVVGSGCFIESVGGGANTNSFGNMYLALPFSREEHNYIIDLLAIGRWK